MKLTARQSTFLGKLLDLYRERQRPIHYSLLAQELQVNKFSAYDMLKVLEKKGMAASQYVLRRSGPGRSSVLFYPTARAFSQLGEMSPEDWERTREAILTRLREARAVGEQSYREFRRELMVYLPESPSPLSYCANMMAALLLNLRDVRERLVGLDPIGNVLGSAASARQQLSTLAGLSLGSYLAARRESSEAGDFPSDLNRFQRHLADLSEESLNQLAELMREVMAVCEIST
jgi:hypothetical protein